MIILFLILILFSAFFSGAEIVYFSLTPGQVKLIQEKNKRFSNLVWKLKNNSQRLLITILIGNNIINIFTASLATVIAVNYFGSLGVGVATGLVTIIILFFGEITPKTFAYNKNKQLALFFAPILYFFYLLLWPLSWVLMHFNDFLIKKIFKVQNNKQITEEEIRSLARLGVEAGAIDYREREMIENIFQFNDIKIKDVMVPKYRVVFLNGNVPVEQIAYFISQAGFSRYPVYENDEENIVGYIHVNDLMKVLNSSKRNTLLKEIVRPLRFIDENKGIEPLFRSMLRNKDHLVMVLRKNRKNEVVGIITLEDILEELVGEIQDETDKDKEIEKL